MNASENAFAEALKYIPGGVNSPVRAFGAVGGAPPFIESGRGARLTDIDGNEYLDYVCSWGPLILGHADPDVISAVQTAAQSGMTFGAPTLAEIELARLVCEAYPSIECLRLVNSGTEATMSAIRLARGYTGRDTIVKFEGCYHGHADGLLVESGSGALTFGTPSSLGVPQDYARHTICLPYNNIDAVRELCGARGGEIACIIVEPVAGNMGLIPPKPGFLAGLREICDTSGITLIFDEVISGFRMALGGAQEVYGITPDLTTLGKILGGGLPVGAYGGKNEIMKTVSPVGGVYQAGTLSGNPLAVAAGITTINKLRDARIYEQLEAKSAALEEGIRRAARDSQLDVFLTRAGSLLCLFFTGQTVVDLETAKTSDTRLFGRFFHAMLKRGIYIAPSQFEAWFLSAAHTLTDIDETVSAVSEAFAELQ